MRSGKAVVLLALLVAPLEASATTSYGASHDQDSAAQRNGKSAVSTRSSPNKNTQWQADPDRGWVRAREARENNTEANPSNSRGDKKTKLKEKKRIF